tara:strand:+ start:5934 stop:6554 length:621 start_codon:yes stop_codon:yes gene_type:complete
MNNKFIVVEGSEGVGKSTQIRTIEKYLQTNSIDYVITREPGGTKFGESIRSIILDKSNDTHELTDSLLFYAARYENYKKVILPALEAGRTVICDRFHYSTLVYQGIVGKNSMVLDIHNIFDSIFSNKIDFILYLVASPEVSLQRISKRLKTDKFESRGLDYLKELDKAYSATFSNIKNTIKIDTSGDKDDTEKNINLTLNNIFKLK